ncbi:AAA family ATPase [Paenibacillus sp. 2TAB23]|uniref:AAA family ATPase n=1 Tax=Paenibacillus sp. 2TAB23 TaxID=3233004 RepID=UPI003F9C4195
MRSFDQSEWISRIGTIAAPLAVMMCGVAGSGKTTYAKQLEDHGFVRLSIDEEIWSTNGRFGIDYSAEHYEQFKIDAELKLRECMIALIQEKSSVVVDFSFWQRKKREEYKRIIEAAGGEWALVWMKVRTDVLRERLRIRSQRFDANAAFPITEEILTRFLNGFEAPVGEGERIVDNG